MSDYREGVNKYKAKRTGQVDAKVVAPKGQRKRQPTPWAVVYSYSISIIGDNSKPYRREYVKEADARQQYDKTVRQGYMRFVRLEFNGTTVLEHIKEKR